jgi:hypothetical protein
MRAGPGSAKFEGPVDLARFSSLQAGIEKERPEG